MNKDIINSQTLFGVGKLGSRLGQRRKTFCIILWLISDALSTFKSLSNRCPKHAFHCYHTNPINYIPDAERRPQADSVRAQSIRGWSSLSYHELKLLAAAYFVTLWFTRPSHCILITYELLNVKLKYFVNVEVEEILNPIQTFLQQQINAGILFQMLKDTIQTL